MASTSPVTTILNTHFKKPVPVPLPSPFQLKTIFNCKKIHPPSVVTSFRNKFEIRAHSMKDKMTASFSTGLLSAAAMVVPDVATAVEDASGGSSSLKNFLFSIAAGTVVLAVILFAVIGVSNFDPVKRN